MVLQVQPTPQTWFFMLIIRFSKIGHVLKIRSLVINNVISITLIFDNVIFELRSITLLITLFISLLIQFTKI